MKEQDSGNQSHNSNKQKRSRSRSKEKKTKIQSNKKKIVNIKVPDFGTKLYNIQQFTLLQSEDTHPDNIHKGYERYRRDWQQRKNQEFINEHKEDGWFNDKYNPLILELIENEKAQIFRRKHAEFMNQFKEGFYNRIDLRVKDIDNLGTIYHDNHYQYQQSNKHFLNNQIIEIDLSNRINIAEAPFYGYNSDKCTIFIKGISRQISRFDIKNIAKKLDGYQGLTMSDPIIKANYTRHCWIQFDNQQDSIRAVLSMNGIILKNQTLNVSKSHTKIKLVRIIKNYPSSRLKSDIETLCRLVKNMDGIIGIQQNILTINPFQSLQHKFDILLTYLRKVHSFDYYTCTQYQNQRALAFKTGTASLRIEVEYDQLPEVRTVFKGIQQLSEAKCSQFTHSPGYLTMLYKQLQNIIAQNRKEPIQGIYPCMKCDKKFKNCDFLAKHLLLKHQDVKEKGCQVVMQKLYIDDPLKYTKRIHKKDGNNQQYFSSYRRQSKKDPYLDFDEPEEIASIKNSLKPLVNFLDI